MNVILIIRQRQRLGGEDNGGPEEGMSMVIGKPSVETGLTGEAIEGQGDVGW